MALRSATGSRLVSQTGATLVSASGDLLGCGGYALQDMQVYRVTGVTRKARAGYKTIELEKVKSPTAKVL